MKVAAHFARFELCRTSSCAQPFFENSTPVFSRDPKGEREKPALPARAATAVMRSSMRDRQQHSPRAPKKALGALGTLGALAEGRQSSMRRTTTNDLAALSSLSSFGHLSISRWLKAERRPLTAPFCRQTTELPPLKQRLNLDAARTKNSVAKNAICVTTDKSTDRRHAQLAVIAQPSAGETTRSATIIATRTMLFRSQSHGRTRARFAAT
jgi:hypothetical protein